MLRRALSRYVSGLTSAARGTDKPLKVSVTQPMTGS
jgi:hypothetical protein